MTVIEALKTYALRIRELRRANVDVPETALAPAFQQLLVDLLPLLPSAPALVVVPEYNNPGVGRPDIALIRQGAPPRAFVELKAPSISSDPNRWRDRSKQQYERFRELTNWATCNFIEFRLFQRNEEQGRADVVPRLCLLPETDDRRADRLIEAHDVGSFLRFLENLCASAGQEPTARDAEHLASLMAHSARLVRSIVKDRLAELGEEPQHALMQVRQEFRDVLYAHPEVAGYSSTDFDALFSAAFAQTLAFGLLLVREATGVAVGDNAWQQMPEEHPLMRTALRVLSLPEVVADIGVGFEVMRDTVNSFSPEILAIRADGYDPILYFYEDFLQTFDPAARERYGVYYTPIEVVRYMVGALDRALRDNLSTQGLRDPAVTILDPATGTGTFLLGIAERVAAEAELEAGRGMAALALQNLAGRMYGFELLVGPYAVAHYRLHHALRRPRADDAADAAPLELPRLGVYLADTLAQPGAAAALGPLGFVSEGISAERREANRIKSDQPILAIIGNPPYRRLEEGENRTLVGDWLDHIWDDLKEPVRNAGQGGQLNTFPELSVAFWRWAIWKIFEAENAPQRGVVAFITNRKFLTGWPYAGLRKMMRERFDRIEIIDLRGDVRRGERAGIDNDHGVFNIQVGTAITLAISDGSKPEGAVAEVHYYDSWTEGYFSRRAKLGWLVDGAGTGILQNGVEVGRDLLDDMRPKPFMNGDLIGISECFLFQRSGLQTKRDHLVYSPSPVILTEQIENFLSVGDDQARDIFHDTRDRKWLAAKSILFETRNFRRVAYRPFDQRYLYNHSLYGDFLRPELQEVWGADNFGLYAMSSGTGAGPAVWCHGLIPDYHAFRNRGGYAFPLYDRRPGMGASNLSPLLIEGLSAAYGEPVTPEDIFDVILCLLSATTYSLRFAEDLEDVFPHIPFPASKNVFDSSADIGREIRSLEAFSRFPGERYRRPDMARVVTAPHGNVVSVTYDAGAIIVGEGGSGSITGIPQEVWRFSVSGYPVLPRWLEARVGLPCDLSFVQELRDICGRIAELIDLFAQADNILEATLSETLTREALGFDIFDQAEHDTPE